MSFFKGKLFVHLFIHSFITCWEHAVQHMAPSLGVGGSRHERNYNEGFKCLGKASYTTLRKGCPSLSRNSITPSQKMGPVLKDKQDWGRAVGGIQMGEQHDKR